MIQYDTNSIDLYIMYSVWKNKIVHNNLNLNKSRSIIILCNIPTIRLNETHELSQKLIFRGIKKETNFFIKSEFYFKLGLLYLKINTLQQYCSPECIYVVNLRRPVENRCSKQLK